MMCSTLKRRCLSLLLLVVFAPFTWAQIQFGTPVKYDLNAPQGGGGYQSLAVADFNSDGRPDAAVGVADGVIIIMNKGDGTFGTTPITYGGSGGSGIGVVLAADFNRDGHPDLAALSDYGGNLYVFLNNGYGAFGSPSVYHIGFRGKGLGMGNFDEDGILDLVASANGVLDVFHGNGDGTFTLLSTSNAEFDGLQVADLNGDGLDDLYTDFVALSVTVMLNKGHGIFGPAMTNQVDTNQSITLPAVDLKNNAHPDIFAIWNNSYDVPYLIDYNNDGAGKFQSDKRIMADPRYGIIYSRITSFDVDLDGRPDIAVLGAGDGSRFIEIFRGNGNGLDPPQTFSSSLTDPDYQVRNTTPLAIADVDGNGRLDILFVTYQQNPSGTFLWVVPNLTPTAGRGTAVTSVFPDHGGNAGTVSSVEIVGTGFPPDVQLTLTRSGPDIKPTSFTVSAAGNLINANFSLVGATPGSYTLVLTDKNGTVLLTKPAAFTVVQGGAPDIWVDFIGRSAIRAGKQQTYYILVGNRGNVDASFANVWLKLPSLISWSNQGIEPSDVITIGNANTLFFDIAQTISAGGTITLPIGLVAPDDPKYAHVKFNTNIWSVQ